MRDRERIMQRHCVEQATHNVAALRGKNLSPHAHRDFVARPIKVGQPHGHGRSRCDAARDANAHPTHAGRA